MSTFFPKKYLCEHTLQDPGQLVARIGGTTLASGKLCSARRTINSSGTPHVIVKRADRRRGDLLESTPRLRPILPHFKAPGDYDLLVVGAGRYEAELHRLARGMDRVRFVGWKNQDQLGDYYRHALGVVVPSLTYETFGIVVIEAFAHNKPVIVNDLGALPELVKESAGGLVYQGRQQMGEQLDQLARDPDLRRQLGECGRGALCKKWSAAPHLARYYLLIRQAREEKARRDV